MIQYLRVRKVRFSHGLLHYLHLAWKLVNASVKAFTAPMEASTEDMEAMEASMNASREIMEAVKASMEDMEDMKVSRKKRPRELPKKLPRKLLWQ